MAVQGQRFMTKTQHYRKVTKPLLERKRRARMNLYLDELKDLIADTMDAQGDQVSKLEKADILELTVNYLKTQQQLRLASPGSSPACSPSSSSSCSAQVNFDKFRAGYTQAAYEVSHIFSTVPGLDLKFGTRLMKQLGHQLKDLKEERNTPELSEEHVNLLERKLEQHQHEERPITPPLQDDDNDNPNGEDVWRPW
ncbi:enhancer of split mdelta protein [Drosophila guanche]|uniref:Blast:Enhancer of split mdelta protein n=1 Tax=Drosophila guanche TaxID=7266 RepID=A0A3B0KZR2_DROGU|nr:enhancer of split mdelta protein [Drosophila guanche]SPP89588.1 blast:Enhancer of split mdelta protein [Drosophila guanche]